MGLRHALRALSGHPGYTAAAVLTLALGIGANTAIFSVVDAVLLRPLPFPEPDRLIDVLAVRSGADTDRVAISPADFLAWRSAGRVFQDLGAYVPFGTLDWTGGAEPVRLSRHLVSEGLLAALGVRPDHGRLFVGEEYRQGRQRVALLSHRLWRTRFGADPGAVGRSLTLGGEVYEVVGVLPRDFRIRGGEPDLLLPLAFGPEAAADRESSYLGAIGRLRPGISLERARREMDALGRQLPEEDRVRASLVPLHDVLAGPARAALLVLFGAVAFVLLIACANVAGLQLVRAASRQPEIVLRSALGADRRRLARQLLAESGVLAVLGGAGGVLLAILALRLLPDVRGIYLPRDVEVGVDLRVLGFTLLLTLLAALVSGLAPALRGSRADLRGAFQAGSAGSQDGGRTRLQDSFVVAEIALALVLLAGAGLMLRSFVRLMGEDPGFEPRQVLTLEIELPAARYPEAAQAAAFYDELVARIARLPGVTAAGAVKELPPDTPWGFQPVLVGQEEPEEESAGWELVTPGYFAAMGTPVLRGWAFSSRDREGSRPVTVINESAVRRFFATGDPIGQRMRFNGVWHEVVGVVRDQKVPGEAAGGSPVFYFAHAQLAVPPDYLRSMAVAVRTEGDPLAQAAAVRRTLWSLDADLPAAELQPLERRLAGGLFFARSHFNTVLLVLFAGLALLLAMIGIAGLLSYRVSRRTRELGIRMALGAQRFDLLRQVMAHGLALTVLGLVLGLAGAVSLTRVLASLLYGLGTLDPLTLGAVVLLLATAASLACYLPARRASRLEPVTALRAAI